MSFAKELRELNHDSWEQAYQHEFVQKLGKGTLDKKAFQFYLIQDYHYLLKFAQVHAIGASKQIDEDLLRKLTNSQYSILNHEMATHIDYMESFDISMATVKETPEALFNKTYTANMLAVANAGDITATLVAVLPCAWTYYDFAKRLKADYASAYPDNFYKSWIDTYLDAEYIDSFAWMFDVIDNNVVYKSSEEKANLQQIFKDSLQFEYLFWEMSDKQALSAL